MLSRARIQPLIAAALREDIGRGDLTSRLIPATRRIRADIVAKSSGVAAGVKMAVLTFATLDPSLRCRIRTHSGASLTPGKTILTVEGRARSIFAAERTALNFLMHLSGVATLTHQFVKKIRGTRARIFDTRKTIPGLRMLEKYAVQAGGGQNHRMGLDDAVLIKTNHLKIMAQGSRFKEQVIQEAIRETRQKAKGKFVEVEVTNLREFVAALQAKSDAILLDNWTIPNIRRAVMIRNLAPRTLRLASVLEVSGGVTLENVRAIARTGVERISVGRLTHSAPALDVSLRVV